MPYVIFYYIMLRVFRSNHHSSWKFHKFHRKTTVLESLFFLEMMKLYKDICSAWIKVDLHSVNVSHVNDAIHWQIYIFFNLHLRRRKSSFCDYRKTFSNGHHDRHYLDKATTFINFIIPLQILLKQTLP